jgi:tetratricopeptide (TPR) repeat protein
MTRRMKALLISFAVLAVATAVPAQESLTSAKDLYASAAYEDALSALTRLHDSAATGAPIAAQIDQYRAFCLFALGRTAEAQSVAESLIAKDPLLRLDDGDASPRIVAMFADVRKRLLPGLARDQYRAARASLDRKDFASAEAQLTRTRRMLDEEQNIGSSDETVADLRVLVDGFIELTRSAEARATDQRAQASATSPSAAGPSVASLSAATPSTAGSALAAPARGASAPNTPAQPQLYDSSALDVVAPVALHQAMPSIPPGLTTMMSTVHKSGMLDIIVDQQGNVERAVMRERVHPIFDTLVLDAAQNWKYRPAMKDGVAVRYLKTIAIVKQ